jgi:hypothetical protein
MCFVVSNLQAWSNVYDKNPDERVVKIASQAVSIRRGRASLSEEIVAVASQGGPPAIFCSMARPSDVDSTANADESKLGFLREN